LDIIVAYLHTSATSEYVDNAQMFLLWNDHCWKLYQNVFSVVQIGGQNGSKHKEIFNLKQNISVRSSYPIWWIFFVLFDGSDRNIIMLQNGIIQMENDDEHDSVILINKNYTIR